MKRVFAIGALVCILTGCGTVQNFERGGSATNAVPYGGVEIAAERLKSPSPGADFMRVDVPPGWLAEADVVFSAIGDTLTLPITIALQVTHDLNEYYFPPDEPPANPRREPRDQPKPPPATPPARTPNP